MRIVGVGIDVVDPGRVERLIGSPRFWRHWLGEAEQRACRAAPSVVLAVAEHLAAKEAAWKAIGVTAWRGGVPWAQLQLPPAGRQQFSVIALSGSVAEQADRAGIERIRVTWDAADELVIAAALAEGRRLS